MTDDGSALGTGHLGSGQVITEARSQANRWILTNTDSGWRGLVTDPSDSPVMSQSPDCYLHSWGQVSTSYLSLTPLFPELSSVTVLAIYEISATKIHLMISNIAVDSLTDES